MGAVQVKKMREKACPIPRKGEEKGREEDVIVDYFFLITSFGASPYGGLNNQESVEKVMSGYDKKRRSKAKGEKRRRMRRRKRT